MLLGSWRTEQLPVFPGGNPGSEFAEFLLPIIPEISGNMIQGVAQDTVYYYLGPLGEH